MTGLLAWLYYDLLMPPYAWWAGAYLAWRFAVGRIP